MKIPTPEEIGLPEKFDKWRSGQEQAVHSILTDRQRATVICGPTGFGKTPVYVAPSMMSGEPTCIVTESLGLQDQLMADFKEVGMVDIRGRARYECEMRPEYTCEDGYASRCPYKGTSGCPASKAEMKAATSKLVVTNYDKWIASRKYGTGMNHFTRVVFDEAHRAPEALAKAMQVFLSPHEINDILGVDFPKPADAVEMRFWKIWAKAARIESEFLMKSIEQKIKDAHAPKTSWVKEFNHLRNLTRRLGVIMTAQPFNWVVEELNGGFQFDPIRPGIYAESTLLLNVPRIIAVSATVRPKTMYMMGLSKDKFTFHEFDSSFDRSRCPIYWIPTMRVDNKTSHNLSLLWARLDQIASRRKDRKGIVHTVSYEKQTEILARSRYAKYMLTNRRGESINDTISSFKASDAGSILVSPSVGTGYDFPGSECEWQFICKIPFPDGRSKIMQARQDVHRGGDPEYGPYQAMQYLVQAFGRGARSESDQCENFIADDHCAWFMSRYAHLAPKCFIGNDKDNIEGFYRRIDTLPKPPRAL